MNRRSFLKASAFTSLSMLMPWGASSQARAETLKYGGPYFFNLHAHGGWDPTLSFDPKRMNGTEVVNKFFAEGDIKTFGSRGMRYADVPLVDRPNNLATDSANTIMDTLGSFMTDHGNDFVFFNGIDTATNNHELGMQLMGSGRSTEVIPGFAALVAAKVAQQFDVPLAFIGAGGYEGTSGIVPLSRASGGVLGEVAYPNRVYGSSPNYLNLGDSTFQKVMAARNASLNAQLAKAGLPRTKAALAALKDARGRTESLNTLVSQLPVTPVKANVVFPQLATHDTWGELESTLGQVELSLTAFKEGLSASSSLWVTGFDTHTNHDFAQTRVLANLILTLRYLMRKAAALGIADKLYVLVTSDFGRTPGYNAGNGKDHWNITSALLSGPSTVVKNKGGVVGATDAGHKPLNVTADNLHGVPATVANSTRLLPAHLHGALRDAFGITNSPIDRQFSLPGHIPLPVFG